MNDKDHQFFGSTTMGERGQVVIPQEAREALGLEKGEKLLVMGFKGGNLMLMKFSNFKKMQEKLAKTQDFINKILKEN
jgi:AbrB family looped-hinge helix DNA binding protein